MKSATIPSVRVEPELREAVESLLVEGETVSEFVEASVRATVLSRRHQAEFICRGLRSLDDACRTGDYVDADVLVRKLQRKLETARARIHPRKSATVGVGIRTLKNQLSEYVRAAAAGETVLVIDHGQVVAALVSHRVRADASQDEQRLGDLMRQGLLSPAKTSPMARLPRRKPVAKIADLLHELDDGRAES